MKNRIVFLVLMICALIVMTGCKDLAAEKKQSAELYPAYVMQESGKKWGYINDEGTFIIKPKYETVADFQSNGMAAVSENERWGLIDKTGKTVIALQYASVSSFSGKTTLVTDGLGKSFLLDEKSRILFQTEGSIDKPSCGLAAFSKKVKQDKFLWGYINEAGKVLIEPNYDYAQTFTKDKAIVQISAEHYGIIDKQGKILKEINNQNIMGLADNSLVFTETDKENNQKYGYKTLDGKIMLKAAYLDAEAFEDGLAVVNAAKDFGNAYGVINPKGEFVIPAKYSRISSLKNGIYAVPEPQDDYFENNYIKKALFDKSGRQLSEFKYYDLERLENGLISATDDKKTYLIDEWGNEIKRIPKADGIGSIKPSGKLYKVEVDNQLYYLNEDGKRVWSADNTIQFASGLKVKMKTFRPDRCMLIQYPQLDGLQDTKVQGKINQLLQDNFIGDKQASNKDGKNYTDSIEINFAVEKNKDLLIINQNGYYYPIGAAHGQPTWENYHIDIKSGTFYTLKDLFKADSQYSQKLTERVKQKIVKANMIFGEQYYSEDIEKLNENSGFAIKKGALLVYFQPYEIACYAAGFPEFYISYAELADLINTDGAFWKSFDRDLSAPAAEPADEVYPSDKALLEEAMKNYENKIIEAINQNDFSLVETWLYPESSLYTSQKKLVFDLHQKGIKESLDSYAIKAIEAGSSGVMRVYTTEKIKIQYPGKEAASKQFNWIYYLRYDYDRQHYQLTYIEKWEK